MKDGDLFLFEKDSLLRVLLFFMPNCGILGSQ